MIPTSTVVWLCIVAAWGVLLPVAVLIWWRKTQRAKLLPALVGALAFVVFALVLEPLLHRLCVLGDNPVSRAINANPYLYMLYGGLAAGVFEETGRYVAFRTLAGRRRFPERATAVTYGIGHGGIESVLLLGSAYAVYAAAAILMRGGGAAAVLPLVKGDTAALVSLAAVLAQTTPGVCLLLMVERTAALLLHIALSCFVFLAARDRSQRSWFPFAIALHAVADMPAALYQKGMLPMWAVELWICVVALYALRSARKCWLEEMDP